MKRMKDLVEGRGMLPTEAKEEGKGVAQWQSACLACHRSWIQDTAA